MKIFEKQGYHFVFLLVLIGGVYITAKDSVLSGSFWNLSTKTWLILAVLVPILHQVFVVFCWRAELYYGWLTKTFGDKAFKIWAVGFMILFSARPITIIGLAISNSGTFILSSWLRWSLSGVFLLLVIYLAYSVAKYFGIERALGMDHFQPEKYRDLPFVKQGIYRWIPNSMYLVGFLFLWVPGLLLSSKAALLAALFNHLYIWVHYYFTEYPDMLFIYQKK